MTLCRMEESVDKVYAQHRGLIRSLINHIVVNNPQVVDTQDLQQAGALALVVALQSYDSSQGSFSSYIRKCIRNALLKEANSFSGVFTTNEKVRRRANAIVKMRAAGLSDDTIMTRLGITSRATFLSLVELVENRPIELDQIEIEGEAEIEEENILKMLDEIGLEKDEMKLVSLLTTNHSMDEIVSELGVSRTTVYNMRASIMQKILTWGQDK